MYQDVIILVTAVENLRLSILIFQMVLMGMETE